MHGRLLLVRHAPDEQGCPSGLLVQGTIEETNLTRSPATPGPILLSVSSSGTTAFDCGSRFAELVVKSCANSPDGSGSYDRHPPIGR
jgi:hypothetical protein